jgi:hypothetical protein
VNDPKLCPALRWKSQFYVAERDESIPTGNDASFWCLHTQNCVGPDGRVAEPATCCNPRRECRRGQD